MKTLAAVITVFALSACSHRVYSPPSQAFGIGPVHAMAPGQRTFDVEVASHSQIFDPAVRSAAGRYNHSVGNNTEVSAEGTLFGVEGAGSSPENRNFAAGRVGARNSPGEDAAVFAGVGGGYAPAGGPFATLDGGVTLGIHNCVLVPVVQLSGFVSQPLDPEPIDVTEQANQMTYDTPSRTFGGQVRGGLRLSLDHDACRRGEASSWLYTGLDYTNIRDDDSSDEMFGLGLGLTVPL